MNYADNLLAIETRIAAACQRVGRSRKSVELLAVSKGQPPQAIRALSEEGLILFGENKVQEAKAKISSCPSHLKWHMIGHLQSNKCRDAVMLFDFIQGVDGFELAQELVKWAEKLGRTKKVLLEVNVGGEGSKYGLAPADVVPTLLQVNDLAHLEVHGLMTIAPYSPDPEQARKFFRKMHECKSACEVALGVPLPHLSMGMSGDFEVAIEEGATLIRIGTALFGPRSITKTLNEFRSQELD